MWVSLSSHHIVIKLSVSNWGLQNFTWWLNLWKKEELGGSQMKSLDNVTSSRCSWMIFLSWFFLNQASSSPLSLYLVVTFLYFNLDNAFLIDSYFYGLILLAIWGWHMQMSYLKGSLLLPSCSPNANLTQLHSFSYHFYMDNFQKLISISFQSHYPTPGVYH